MSDSPDSDLAGARLLGRVLGMDADEVDAKIARTQRLAEYFEIKSRGGMFGGASDYACFTCGAHTHNDFADLHLAWHRDLGQEPTTRTEIIAAQEAARAATEDDDT